MKILNSNSFVFAFDDVVIARNTLSWKMMLYDVKNHFSSFSSFCPCQHKTFTSKVLQSTDSLTRQFQMISYTSFTHILRSEIILIVQNVCNTEKCQNKNQQMAWSAKRWNTYRTKMHSQWCDEWQDGNFFIAWNWNWNNSLTRKLLQNDVERFYDQARAERYKKYFLILDNMYTSHSSESRVLLKCSMKKHLTPISSSSA